MIPSLVLPFIRDYVDVVSAEMSKASPEFRMTRKQKLWISFCLCGILLTNTICWKKYYRASFGGWTLGALSWMFRHSKINWPALLVSSVSTLLKQYGIKSGVLDLDDTDRERSKTAKHLYKLGKQKDKKSGGYFNGQSIVFLFLVSGSVSIPVGFRFYETDPEVKAWRKKDEGLKKKGVKPRFRPPEPPKNGSYPSKTQLAIDLVKGFKKEFSEIKIKAVLADALFGSAEFMDTVSSLYGGIQVISQIRNNQKIRVNGKECPVGEYFSGRAPIGRKILIRGGKQVSVWYSSVIAKVEAHGSKRLIIALKYEDETDFRYIIARDMTWRVQEVLECFTIRWLIEVFFQDWKMYEGWGQLTKHVGAEGSRWTLILSLLFDHCLLSHPAQAARIKANLPAYTVGSLRDRLSIQCLLQFFEHILDQPNPKEDLQKLVQAVEEVYELRVSSKHLSGRQICFGD